MITRMAHNIAALGSHRSIRNADTDLEVVGIDVGDDLTHDKVHSETRFVLAANSNGNGINLPALPAKTD